MAWRLANQHVAWMSLAPPIPSPHVRTRLPRVCSRASFLDSIYDAASDTRSRIAKAKLQDLAQKCNQTPPQLGRLVARVEARHPCSHIQPLANNLRDAICRWRSS